MSAEFTMIGDGGAATATTYGEFQLTLTLAGDAETARARLAAAIEKLGYIVTCDEPLMARRGETKGGGVITSTVLSYARTVSFRLKPIGTNATLVSFNYTGYPLNYKYARKVVTGEAEAIIALAAAVQKKSACAACGTESNDASRFCRSCGAPVSNEPAELQTMRIADSAHAGTRDLLVGSTLFAFAFLILVLVVSIKGIAYINSAAIFAMILTLPGLFWTTMGFRHLSRVLNSKQTENSPTFNQFSSAPSSSEQIENNETIELQLPPASVVENTTELLKPLRKESDLIGVKRNNEAS